MPVRELIQAIAAMRKWERENPEEARVLAPTLAALAASLQTTLQYFDDRGSDDSKLPRKARAVVE